MKCVGFLNIKEHLWAVAPRRMQLLHSLAANRLTAAYLYRIIPMPVTVVTATIRGLVKTDSAVSGAKLIVVF